MLNADDIPIDGGDLSFCNQFGGKTIVKGGMFDAESYQEMAFFWKSY